MILYHIILYHIILYNIILYYMFYFVFYSIIFYYIIFYYMNITAVHNISCKHKFSRIYVLLAPLNAKSPHREKRTEQVPLRGVILKTKHVMQ